MKQNEKINFENNYIKTNLNSYLVKDSYAWRQFTNTFTIFNSIDNILLLIYSTKSKSIICFDVNSSKKISEIKNVHKEYVINLRHFLDTINKRDIIISLFDNNHLKLWNARNFECIFYLSNFNMGDGMGMSMSFSSYLLKENNNNYIITSSYGNEPIRIFDFNGNKVKEINNSKDSVLVLDNYYDINLSKNFIITGNRNSVKSYDFSNNKLYYKYFDNCEDKYHSDIIIKNEDNIIKLIASCKDGNIRIWNFHSGLLLMKINLMRFKNQYCLCLWDNEYLLVGCCNNIILLVDYKKGLLIGVINVHNDNIMKIVKIIHKNYGECLISQGFGYEQIKIWNFKK